jgi:hypothetical protein
MTSGEYLPIAKLNRPVLRAVRGHFRESQAIPAILARCVAMVPFGTRV